MARGLVGFLQVAAGFFPMVDAFLEKKVRQAFVKAYVYIAGVTDGDPGAAGVGVIIRDPCGAILASISRYVGVTTRDIAQYRALVTGLREAEGLWLRRIKIYTDSMMLPGQVACEYPFIGPRVHPLHGMARRCMQRFDQCEVIRIPSGKIEEAKDLAQMAVADCKVIQFPVERLHRASS
jgi:ribonuclease HI